MAQRTSHLGRRFVGWMLIASALLSLAVSGVQLYGSYNERLTRLQVDAERIKNSFQPALENAVLSNDQTLLATLAEGILAQPEVTFVRIAANTSPPIERGNRSSNRFLERSLLLTNPDRTGAQADIGEVTIIVSLDQIRADLPGMFLTILGPNLINALILCSLMYVIFERMIARRLRAISQQLAAAENDIQLAKDAPAHPDELDQITASLNDRSRIAQSVAEIAELNSNKLETVLDAATCGIVALSRSGEVTMINHTARHLLGGISTIAPFPWPETVHFLESDSLTPLESDADPVWRALNGEILLGETHLMRTSRSKDNRRYVRVNSASLKGDKANVGFVLVFDDVSIEERNRQVIERKSRLDALSQLTGGIAHDFNNLLASLLYAVDLAEKEQDTDKRTRLLGIASKSIERGRTLTSRLLAFARKQPGMASSRRVSEVFDELRDLVAPIIEAHVTIEFEIVDPELRVFCDTSQLETALMHLLLNSRDSFHRTGTGHKITVTAQPTLAAEIELDDRQSLVSDTNEDNTSFRYVAINILDNGPGMDKETLTRATDPFFTTKQDNAGTGLGLSIVYGFVRQSEGDLRIYSELGVGTSVNVILPRGDAKGEREARHPSAPPVLGNAETILLVEDEEELLSVMAILLENLNYKVVCASSGREALQIAENGDDFDLLLTDVVMPGNLGGFELARKIRALKPMTPVVYMSGYVGFTQFEMGDVQATLLQKPAPPTHLAAALHEAFANQLALTS